MIYLDSNDMISQDRVLKKEAHKEEEKKIKTRYWDFYLCVSFL